MKKKDVCLYQRRVELIDRFVDTIPTIIVKEIPNSYYVGNIDPDWILHELLYTYNCYATYDKVYSKEFCYIYHFQLRDGVVAYLEQEWDKFYDCLYKVIKSYDDDIKFNRVLVKGNNSFVVEQDKAIEFLVERLEENKEINFELYELPFGDGEVYFKTHNFPNNIMGNMMFDVVTHIFHDCCKKYCKHNFTFMCDNVLYEEYDDELCSYSREKSGDYRIEMNFQNENDKKMVKAYALNDFLVLVGRRFNDKGGNGYDER